MRLRTLVLLIPVSFLGLFLFGLLLKRSIPGHASGEDGGVKVYFADHISPAHELLIRRFNEQHRGSIEVVPVDLPFDKFSTNERKELLARSLRTKSEKLDVFAVDLIWVKRFAQWAERLEPYVPAEVRENILPTALASCMADGGLVAIPMYIDVGLMYYRRDLILSLPDGPEVERRILSSISWDEMHKLRRRMGYENRPFYVFPARNYEGLICCFFELGRGFDPQFPPESGIGLSSVGAQRALETLRSFVRTGFSPRDVLEFDEILSYGWFLENDAVFVRGWPNFVENFRTTYPDTSKLSLLGRAPLPHVAGSPPTSVFGGWNLMISRTSSRKEEAGKFLRYVTSPEAQRLLLEHGGYIPIRNEIYELEDVLAARPELRFYRDLLDKGFHRPAMRDYTKASDILSYFVQRAVRGDISPTAALARADSLISTNAVLVR